MTKPSLRRRDEGRRRPITVYVDSHIRQAIDQAAQADGVAPAVFARAALERGLPNEIDARRKRRARTQPDTP